LARHLSDILLGQLTLRLTPALTAESRLELRHPILAELAELLAERLLPGRGERPLAPVHGCVLQVRLALQRADDLRQDRQDLPHHLVHVLLREHARPLAILTELAIGGVAELRLLRLGKDVRQCRNQLPHHLAHVLWRQLALMLAPPLRLPAPS